LRRSWRNRPVGGERRLHCDLMLVDGAVDGRLDHRSRGLFPLLGAEAPVGEVDGEVLNATPTLTLSNAQLSIVVFDVAGNVIGGGTGATSGAVPSGSRIVFVAQAGFTALPIDKAATAIVSAEPTYTNGI